MGAVLWEVGYAHASRGVVVSASGMVAGRARYLGVVGCAREGVWWVCLGVDG